VSEQHQSTRSRRLGLPCWQSGAGRGGPEKGLKEPLAVLTAPLGDTTPPPSGSQVYSLTGRAPLKKKPVSDLFQTSQ
ncbi:unnamed protein product, partial [Rangifer tarandus platyrhynchus]